MNLFIAILLEAFAADEEEEGEEGEEEGGEGAPAPRPRRPHPPSRGQEAHRREAPDVEERRRARRRGGPEATSWLPRSYSGVRLACRYVGAPDL